VGFHFQVFVFTWPCVCLVCAYCVTVCVPVGEENVYFSAVAAVTWTPAKWLACQRQGCPQSVIRTEGREGRGKSLHWGTKKNCFQLLRSGDSHWFESDLAWI